MRQVCIEFTLFTRGVGMGLHQVCSSNLFTPDLHNVCIVYTEFTHCSPKTGGFSGEFPPGVECANLMQILCILGKLLQTFCKQTSIYECKLAQCKLFSASVNIY